MKTEIDLQKLYSIMNTISEHDGIVTRRLNKDGYFIEITDFNSVTFNIEFVDNNGIIHFWGKSVIVTYDPDANGTSIHVYEHDDYVGSIFLRNFNILEAFDDI